jgi:hypothetical protein
MVQPAQQTFKIRNANEIECLIRGASNDETDQIKIRAAVQASKALSESTFAVQLRMVQSAASEEELMEAYTATRLDDRLRIAVIDYLKQIDGRYTDTLGECAHSMQLLIISQQCPAVQSA